MFDSRSAFVSAGEIITIVSQGNRRDLPRRSERRALVLTQWKKGVLAKQARRENPVFGLLVWSVGDSNTQQKEDYDHVLRESQD